MRRFLFTLVLLLLVVALLPPLAAHLFGWNHSYRDLPPRGKTVEISGGRRLHYTERGEGSPIVLVHGLASTAADWADLPDELAETGHRVIAYDRVGYGYSSRPDPDAEDGSLHYTLEANAADLLDLLDALSIDRAALVGWSYGGAIVQTLALQSPERVSHLVLIGSVGPAWRDGASRRGWLGSILASGFGEAFLAWVRSIPPLGHRLLHDALVDAFSDEHAIPEGWIDYTRTHLALPGTLRAVVEEQRRSRPENLQPESLNMPSLVIHGTDDRIVNYAVAEDLQRRLPKSRLETVFAGSHMLPVTHPTLLAEKIHGLLGPGYIMEVQSLAPETTSAGD